ncbi:MAG TPA: hypothetical protein VGQ11_02265 [Candidatus Acidoferrales bacterium]|jgi:hypothetical protein|nr:hypothetical protein [Candidatus Acidoferrales bacterium]
MKGAGIGEIAKKLTVVLLFVLFGFCAPGYAASNDTAVTERGQ